MKKALAFLLLALGCKAAVTTGTVQEQGLDAGLGAPVELHNRFGRRLAQVDAPALVGNFPLYLVPTTQPDLCDGKACCQADDYSSPYRLQQLNASTTSVAGRQYTTFYMQLVKQEFCDVAVDANGCCQADIQTIWLDVDPQLKVLFATLDGSPSAVVAEQGDLGFSMRLVETLKTVPTQGTILTLTIAGAVDVLCAPSDMAPIKGYCNVIIEGGSSAGPSACCPQSLSLAPRSTPDFAPPHLQCVSETALSSGATSASAVVFDLSLQSVTLPYEAASVQDRLLSNYTFLLTAPTNCVGAGPNSCCDMGINAIVVHVEAGVKVAGVELAGIVVPFTLEGTASSTGLGALSLLVVSHLSVTSSMVPSEGMPLKVTVRLPVGQNAVPNLCGPVDHSAGGGSSAGPCSYSLRSTDSFCCPAADTSIVTVGLNVNSPPPPMPPTSPGEVSSPPPAVLAQPPSPPMPPTIPGGAQPPSPPPAAPACNPQIAAPLTDTSMGLQYYEGPNALPSTTSFVFMVSNHNGEACTKLFCLDTCGWTLFVNPDLASQLSVVSEDPSNGEDPQTVQEGANASVTFTFSYGHLSEGTLLYTISLPSAGIALSQLCRKNALPGQGTKECAAIVRGPTVFSTVFFDQSDVIITSPSLPQDVCPTHSELAGSCAAVDSARYNSASGESVFSFVVSDHAAQKPGCLTNTGAVKFMVLLNAAAAVELVSTQNTVPPLPLAALFTSTSGGSSGVSWIWVPSTLLTSHGFKLSPELNNPSAVCAQGVLPDQAVDTCMVAFVGDHCFSGAVALTLDASLTWQQLRSSQDGGGGGSGSSKSATVGIAVGVTLGVLFLALCAFLVFGAYRRKKSTRSAEAATAARGALRWDSFDDLAAPLTSRVSAGGASSDGGSVTQGGAGSVTSHGSRRGAGSDAALRVPLTSQ